MLNNFLADFGVHSYILIIYYKRALSLFPQYQVFD